MILHYKLHYTTFYTTNYTTSDFTLQITLALRARAILVVFEKIYSCLFISNCTRNYVITYTNVRVSFPYRRGTTVSLQIKVLKEFEHLPTTVRFIVALF